jgi:eukaryotic-like serine/threonine-protein kinase
MAVQRIGKYQITGEIGSGGFGRVYSAQDRSVGRIVAIKVMNAPGDTDLVRRFHAEAMTVAKLAHKNIVTVHDYGEQDGAPYLVMEYLEGINLQDLIKQGTLSLLEKVEIMTEVAEGLHCAHKQGITHRDVKPANIMRLADGSVKIMDFGIARIASESANRLTQTGFIVGTWAYMAPEQFNGTSDAQSDIFAYGVTFYELLTGRNPFSAPDPAGVFSRITSIDPAPVSSLLPGCPEDLDHLIQKTLAKDREQRYANLQDLVVDAKPILFDLRRGEALHTFAKAGQLLATGQLDAAQSAVRKTLELDPTHAGARQFRTQVEKEIQRRESAVKAGTLLEKAERELREHQFPEALATLAAVRPFVPDDSPLHTRLVRADAVIETARRVTKLLDSTRENLRRLDYNEAFKSVSEALAADPSNNTGKALLEEIRTAMALREAKRRMQEELARAEGLLLTGEAEQALALLQDLERNNPAAPEVAALRQRAEAQWAEETRRQRLARGAAECKVLVRNQQFDEAVAQANRLLAEFPDATELQNLLRHASERLAAKKRAEQIARLKTEAAGYVARQEYDFAIKLLETGVAKLGDDGELTRLLQSAIAGKEALERDQALAQIVEEARQLRRQGKHDEAAGAVERAIQIWGDSPQLQTLLGEIAAERREFALREIARRAKAALDQKNPDAAANGLRECLKRHGEDTEIRRLLQTAETQIQERERAQRIQPILDAARKSAADARWREAMESLDGGLRQFPGDAVLAAERQKVAAAQAAHEREQEQALRAEEDARRAKENAKREHEQARRAQEETRRAQEEARRAQENARREQEIAQTVLQAQSARERGLAEAATEILNAAFAKHGKAGPLIEEQQRLAESTAERQRAEAIEKACNEARALAKRNQFDEALRILDAAEIRYPGALSIAALRVEIERDRASFRRRSEIDEALAKASEMVQQGNLQSGLYLLEDALKSHPDSRELRDAAARVKTRLEEENRRREIVHVTGEIKQAIATQDLNTAVKLANTASVKFPAAEEIARLKRQAEEGKQRKEVEEAEAGIVKARDAGNLDLAAELATAARIRWANERRFPNLEDEIQETRAEQSVTAARAHAAAERFDQAEKLARQALKRRPNLASATDLLSEIAARREAKKQLEAREEDSKPSMAAVLLPPPEETAGSRTKFVAIAAAAGLLMAAGIVWKLSTRPAPTPKPPPISVPSTLPPTAETKPPSPSSVTPSAPPSAPAATPSTITVSRTLGNLRALQGQEYLEKLIASGGSGSVTWSSEGKLPAGLVLDKTNGHIHGKVSAPKGNYEFTAIATDGAGGKGRADIPIAVVEPAVAAATQPAGGGTTHSVNPPKPEPPKNNPSAAAGPAPATPACKADAKPYFGRPAGEQSWSGFLDASAQVEIHDREATSGHVSGPVLPKGVPVDIIVTPQTVHISKAPSEANCWNSSLVLQNMGPQVSSITITWKLRER